MIYRATLIGREDPEETKIVFVQVERVKDILTKLKNHMLFFELVNITKFWVTITNFRSSKNSDVYYAKYRVQAKSPNTQITEAKDLEIYYIANSIEEVMNYVAEFLDYNPYSELIEVNLVETGLEFIA